MNQLIQLIQNEKQPVTVHLFFENGLSIKLQNVRVLSNHFLVGTNQFPGKTFIPINHIRGYCLLQKNVKKDKKNKKNDKQKETNIEYKETSKAHSRTTPHTYFPDQSFYDGYTNFKEEKKKDYYIDTSLGKEFLSARKIESHEEFSVKKGVVDKGDTESYVEVSIQKDTPSPKQLVSPNPFNKITNSISELQQNKPKKREVLSLDNIKISSTNANSLIKDSGTFTNKYI